MLSVHRRGSSSYYSHTLAPRDPDRPSAPRIDIAAQVIPVSAMDALPEEVARQYMVLPLRVVANQLYVAVAEDAVTDLTQVEMFVDYQIVPYLVPTDLLLQVIEEVYAARRRGLDEWRGPRASRSSSVLPAVTVDDEEAGVPTLTTPSLDTGRTPRPAVLMNAGLAAGKSPHRGKRTLVADDEDGIRRMLADALKKRGFEVAEARDGAEVFERLAQGTFDLLILDGMLPKIHGFDVAQRLFDERPGLPIVMISGVHRGWRISDDARELYGVRAYVEKPFDVGELMSAIDVVLDGGDPAESRDPFAPPTSGQAALYYKESAAAWRTGDLDTAIQFLTGAVKSEPLNAFLHEQLGLLYAHRGHEFKAIGELETVLDLAPRRFQSVRNLAILYQRRGFRRRAIELYERSLAVAPDEDTKTSIRQTIATLL